MDTAIAPSHLQGHVFDDIKRRARTRYQLVIVKYPNDIGEAICVVLTHNKTKEARDHATRERIEKLQKAVGLASPPQWYDVICV